MLLREVFRPDDPVLRVPLHSRSGGNWKGCSIRDLWRHFWPMTAWVGSISSAAGRKGGGSQFSGKIGADEIAPVTQLFTEDYMVLFLLENTLGAWGQLGTLRKVCRGTSGAICASPKMEAP